MPRSPQTLFHSDVNYLLTWGIRQTCPEALRVCREMVVVLGPRQAPEPDVCVITAESAGCPDAARYDARDVRLAVETVDPDSEIRDRERKPQLYAEAGIPHFWRVEMAGEDDHPVVYVYELDPATRAYVATGIHHDRLKLALPFTIDIDLTEIDRL